MDPISIGLAAVGLGISLFGSQKQAGVSQQQAQVSAGISQDEQQINVQKQQQMQLEGRRSQLQNFRNAQRMRANAQAAATNQGAAFGSGLQGGLAGVTNQEEQNTQGINQGMQISQNIFGINSDISNKRVQMAQLGGESAEAQGLSSLGGSLIKAGPIIGGFGKDIYSGSGSNIGGMFMGGGSPSGYGR